MTPQSQIYLSLSIAPLPLLELAPSFWGIEPFSYGTYAAVAAISIGALAYAWAFERVVKKQIADRVVVDLRPNLIVVDGVHLKWQFSSLTQFFQSHTALGEVVGIAAEEAAYNQDSPVAICKSALIRIWPGSLRISEIELSALSETAAVEFTSPVIEVMR